MNATRTNQTGRRPAHPLRRQGMQLVVPLASLGVLLLAGILFLFLANNDLGQTAHVSARIGLFVIIAFGAALIRRRLRTGTRTAAHAHQRGAPQRAHQARQRRTWFRQQALAARIRAYQARRSR